jgi:leucyl/phenylalanyl-tRNA--protein transferase
MTRNWEEMPLDSPSRFPIADLLANRVGDIVATSDALWPELLVDAYEHGIFPWPMGDDEKFIPWFSPKKRALLFFSELVPNRSLEKARKKNDLVFTRDQCFEEVMRRCAAKPRPGQEGTWITDEMREAYLGLHRLERAHSVEAWRTDAAGEKKLVGGIYGVDCGGAFAAESMFYDEPNASKLALLHLIELLKEKGREWLDIQQLTPHLEKLGAREVKRAEYLRLLAQAQSSRSKIF